jgi:SecD/SecF fusion protein
MATGEIIESASVRQNEYGGLYISMDFTSEGKKTFAAITRQIAEGNRGGAPGRLAIVLDGKLYSAPTVQEEIPSGSAQISGDFDEREAFELTNVLNNPLAVPLIMDEKYEVSASLAADAKASSINACYLGAGLIAAFMILYYGIGGLVAVISVAVNVFIVVGVLGSLQATITLPGVAALVLTVGMGVDANILIFERIREELKAGKSPVNALIGGYEKALSTIVDANVTTLITAAILIYLGTGPVKGFGITLAIGICASMFCALVVSRFLLDLLVNNMGVKKILGLNFIPDTGIAFLEKRKPAFTISWIIVLVGVVSLVARHDRIFGIDFTGGDELTIEYTQQPSIKEIMSIAQTKNLGEVNAVFQKDLGDDVERLKIQTESGRGTEVFAGLSEALPNDNLILVGETRIGASVSEDIQTNAIISIVVALLGILLYVALRFELGYGIGAVVATIHDVLMTLGIFVLVGGQFTAPMLAAVLMIVGYSINDTIVVFDRIREELQLDPNTGLKKIVNLAINKVISRSLLTSVTTLLAAVSLYIFGAGIITDFAFVFIVGIITGTFSSIFIASPIFFWWHKGDRKHVEEKELAPNYEWSSSTTNSK